MINRDLLFSEGDFSGVSQAIVLRPVPIKFLLVKYLEINTQSLPMFVSCKFYQQNGKNQGKIHQ